MPYIPKEEQEALRLNLSKVSNVGHYNFLYTEAILKVWNAKPKYETIHKLKRDFNTADTPQEVANVTKVLQDSGANFKDIHAAYELAFTEFYFRVARPYENEKIRSHGDLDGYEEAMGHLNDMARERFNKNIKYVPNENKEQSK